MSQYESREDYLERIYILSLEKDKVRAIDIATSLSYSKPSVSIALKKLKDENLITVDKHGAIELTLEGLNIAMKIYEKHQTITSFLISIGVNEKQALIDACKIEHDLSEESFNAIKELTIKN